MVKSDGRLTDDLDPSDHPPRDACGVFGAWCPGEDVGKLAYYGLYALQHRGQESAGIAVSDGERIVVYKDMGLVAQVFDEAALNTLRGHIAVGHCRYSTTGSSVWDNAQPTFRATATGGVALGHNGNLINTLELAARLAAAREQGAGGWAGGPPGRRRPGPRTPTCSPRCSPARPAAPAPGGVEEAAFVTLRLARGAFSLVFMDEKTLYAARDPQGFRPLVLGRLGRGWVVASETAALDIVGAEFIREVEPGELISIDERGVRTRTFAARPAQRAACSSTCTWPGRTPRSRAGACRPPGWRWAAGWRPSIRPRADLVIPVPESGTPAAIGYAEASGIPYGQGLVKNSYVGRTFIQPSQTIRERGIKLKLNPLRDAIAGKRVVAVDDSIVRGTTQRAIVAMLREAGAAEVHVRISSPPVAWPCFYGIDFAPATSSSRAASRWPRSRRPSGPTRSATSHWRA